MTASMKTFTRPMHRSLVSLALAACAALAQAQVPVEKVTVQATAWFDFDRATLRSADRQTLLAEVAQMKGVTWQTVTATGHTDSLGPPAYNQRLAARRAQAVRSFLLSQGLDPAMVRTEARGPQAPVADNGAAQGRARNRRAEVRFEGVRAAAR